MVTTVVYKGNFIFGGREEKIEDILEAVMLI
jgi:hypothetical protein